MPLTFDSKSTAFTTIPKDNPKDKIEVVVGDDKQEIFYPQVKIQRWDNEANASIRLQVEEDAKQAETVYEDEKGVVWEKGNFEAHMYERDDLDEGGFEFEIHLKEKPKSNVFEFTVNTKELDWFYQDDLHVLYPNSVHLNEVENTVANVKFASIVDLGGGTGEFVAKFGGTCIDNSDDAYAKRVTDNYIKTDITKGLPMVVDKQFDLAIGIGFLKYIPEKQVETTIKEIARISNRGQFFLGFGFRSYADGLPIINTNDREWWLAQFDLYAPGYSVEIFGKIETDQPENVRGSYAVYHKSKGGLNNSAGMDYKTGKAFHVYRPHAVDAVGGQTWGTLNYNKNSGLLEISIDQKWIDNAIYPIIIDPTFGYTSAGALSNNIGANYYGIITRRVGNIVSADLIVTGSGNWTIPAGVTTVIAECWGAGGAGGGRTGSAGSGGGGGGGAYAKKTFTGLTPGNTIAYSVAALVTGGSGNGGDGAATWFSSNDASGCVAAGGKGGTTGNGGTGGAGGATADSYGDTKYKGGDGANGSGSTYGGGGGGGAGNTAAGNNATTSNSGWEKNEMGGSGGIGITGGAGNGYNAPTYNNFGSGGGGAVRTTTGTYTGGSSQPGGIRLIWATGASGTLDKITAYLSGNDPADVSVFLNKLDSGGIGTHAEVASVENTDVATAAGWRDFTAADEALTATDVYMLSASADATDLPSEPQFFKLYYDQNVGTFHHTYTATNYADSKQDPFVVYGNSQSRWKYSIYATYTESTAGTNIKINIGDTWKDVSEMKINIGDTWKTVAAVKQNIGDAWKTVFGS